MQGAYPSEPVASFGGTPNRNRLPQQDGYPSMATDDPSASSSMLTAAMTSPSQNQLGVSDRNTTWAANRNRSGERSGVSTPNVARFGARALSSGRTAAPPAMRESFQSALLAAVQRQMKAFQDDFESRLREYHQADRLRDAAVLRLEEKMTANEGMGTRVDRKIAELTGNCKGLSDEMQTQIRRVNDLDKRFWEQRHQLEEDVNKKISDMEHGIQKVPTNMRVVSQTLEEQHKGLARRLQRLETDFGERHVTHEDTLRSELYNVLARLEDLENHHATIVDDVQRSIVPALPASSPMIGDDPDTSILKQRIHDMGQKVDRVFDDSSELHARLGTKEEQLRTLRTHLEKTENKVHDLADRLERERSDWDGKLEAMRRQATEKEIKQTHQHEYAERLSKRLEEFQEELQSKRLDACSNKLTDGGQGSSEPLQDCQARIESIEDHLSILDSDLKATEHVSALVTELREIVPKVIDHEKALDSLRNQLRDSAIGPGRQATPQAAPLAENIGRLEQRLDTNEAKLSGHLATLEDDRTGFSELQSQVANLEKEVTLFREDQSQLGQIHEAYKSVKELCENTQDMAHRFTPELDTVKNLVMGLQERDDMQSLSSSMTAEIQDLSKKTDQSRTIVDDVLKEVALLNQSMKEIQETGAQVRTLQQDMRGLMDLETSTKKIADGVMAGLHQLQSDVGTFKATLRTEVQEMIEPLNQQIRELPPRRDDEHATAMEHIRRELQDMREQPPRRDDEHANTIEHLRRELQDMRDLPPGRDDEHANAIEHIRRELQEMREQPPRRDDEHANNIEHLRRELQEMRDLAPRRDDEHANTMEHLRRELQEMRDLPPRRDDGHANAIEHIRRELQEMRDLAPRRDDEHANAFEHLRRELQDMRELPPRRDDEHANAIEHIRRELQEMRDLAPRRDNEHANTIEHIRRELQDMRDLPPRRDDEHANAIEHLRRELLSLQEKERLEWLDNLMPVTEEVSRVSTACIESKAKIDLMLDEVQALRQLPAHSTSGMPQQSAEDFDSIKQDIRHLTNMSDSNTDTAEVVKHRLEGLQEEVKLLETKMLSALREAVEQHRLPRVSTELDRLQRQVADLQDLTSSLAQSRETDQSRETERGVRHDVANRILEELSRLAEQAKHGERTAADVLNKVTEQTPEHRSVQSIQHRQNEALDSKLDELRSQIALSRSETQRQWRDQAQPIIEELRRLQSLPVNQGDIVSGVLQEVEALRQVIATNNQTPGLLAQPDTMVAPIMKVLDHLIKLSQQCTDKVNSVADEMDGFRQEMQGSQSSQVVSRGFVTHQALRDEIGEMKKSAAEGRKIAEKVVGEVDGLRQDLKTMNDLKSETTQQHPSIAGLQASEERELQAYEQILLRLDELTERLQTFENAIAGPDALTSSALTQPTFVTKGHGIPAEIADRCGHLVDQYAKTVDLEKQVEAKFSTYTAAFVSQEALAGEPNITQRETSSQLE